MSLRQTKIPWKDWKKSTECGILTKNDLMCRLSDNQTACRDTGRCLVLFGIWKNKHREDKTDVCNAYDRKRKIKGLCQ